MSTLWARSPPGTAVLTPSPPRMGLPASLSFAHAQFTSGLKSTQSSYWYHWEVYGLAPHLSFQSLRTFSSSPSSAPASGAVSGLPVLTLPDSLPHSSVPASDLASNFKEKKRGHKALLSEFPTPFAPHTYLDFCGIPVSFFRPGGVRPLSATGHVDGLRGKTLRLVSGLSNLRLFWDIPKEV